MILGAQEILDADDLPREAVAVPEWGVEAVVLVRGLTGTEREDLESEIAKANKRDKRFSGIRAWLVASAAVGSNGMNLFARTPEVLTRLGQKNSAAVSRLADAILRLSGMAPGAVEEAEKNSESGPVASSTSG